MCTVWSCRRSHDTPIAVIADTASLLVCLLLLLLRQDLDFDKSKVDEALADLPQIPSTQ